MWRMPDWLAFFRGKVSACVWVGERRDVLAGYGIAGELLGLITCGCTYVYFREYDRDLLHLIVVAGSS